MLIINRYKSPINGRVSICAHKVVKMEVVKSSEPCAESFIDLLTQGHKQYIICDVVSYSMLSKINIVKI